MASNNKHRAKVERFHQLVDRELAGTLSEVEVVELAGIRRYFDELDAPKIAAMQERFAMQDAIFSNAMDLYRKARGEGSISAKPQKAAAKTMRAGR